MGDKTRGTMTVHSTNGDITITEEGIPVSLYETWQMMQVKILCFDLWEYKRVYGKLEDEYDVLDLGYWWTTSDGTLEYEKPDPNFREDVAPPGEWLTIKQFNDAYLGGDGDVLFISKLRGCLDNKSIVQVIDALNSVCLRCFNGPKECGCEKHDP